MKSLASLLLLIAVVRHYGWSFFPDEMQGIVSKGFGGMQTLALLTVLWMYLPRSKLMIAVLAWWAWEEIQVSLCSALYALHPWPVAAGQGICSAKIGIDLGAFGIFLVAVLALSIVKSDSDANVKEKAQ